jgi:8-oxo-dGTP pyrophosphatase MutT (NUDIX family)
VPEPPSHPDEHRTITHGERTVYRSDWVRLALVDVEPPGGGRFEQHVVRMNPVAIAVLVNERDEMLMLHRYRFAIDEWGYEFLGGLVDDGEDPVRAAAREAVEESGHRPLGEPRHLVSFQPLPGMVDAPMDIYLWRAFEEVGEPTDQQEAGVLRWIPRSDIPRLIADREFLGAGTLVALLQLLALDRGVDVTQSSA